MIEVILITLTFLLVIMSLGEFGSEGTGYTIATILVCLTIMLLVYHGEEAKCQQHYDVSDCIYEDLSFVPVEVGNAGS